jgi:monofunctional biosynthetic peptidoglycan transglycosylase
VDSSAQANPVPVEVQPAKNSLSKRLLMWGLFGIKWAVIGFFGATLFGILLYAFINPPVTPLMVQRAVQQKLSGKKMQIRKNWVPIEGISNNLVKAVVSSEDNRFLEHWGIDVQAIQKAVDYNKRHKRKRGASTITQQVAKNVYLWPSRTWLRKGFELYFTVMIEAVWSKKRIMEVYLNVMETGDGVYGAEAAARKYFHKPASRLTKGEAALIAACLPSPRKRNPAAPTPYLYRRQAQIMNLMNKIGAVDFRKKPEKKR